MADPPVLVIPGTPLLTYGADPGEPPQMVELRSAVHAALARAHRWTLPVPGTCVPPLVSLGGHGVMTGARVHATAADGGVVRTGLSQPSDLLRGDSLRDAVRELDEAAVLAARGIPTGVVVAVIACLEAGAHIRMVPAGDASTVAEAVGEPLLIPLDFSGAAHPDAPLAPREGAAEFDRALETALTGSVDHEQITALQDRAQLHAAWIEMLPQLVPSRGRGMTLAATGVHRVRYRVFSLDPSAAPLASRPGECDAPTPVGRP